MADVPRRRNLAGTPQYRIVPSLFPPVSLFETLVSPDELEVLYAIESMTNDRLQAEAGNLYLLPREEWVTGPGASVVMAAFTHIGRATRFSSGEYGVYYAGRTVDTAIAETVFHSERRLRDTDEEPIELDMRCYAGTVETALEDIRGRPFVHLRDPDLATWPVAQAFGSRRREAGAFGLLYRSVRHEGGECIAGFRPRAVSLPAQGRHFRYRWNGERIDRVMTVSRIRELQPVSRKPPVRPSGGGPGAPR